MRAAFAFGRAGLFASADPPAIFPQSLKYGMVACTLARMDSNLVVRALGALAHESRLAIFRALVVAGQDGLPAGEIAQQLGLAPSSLSFHLKDLSHAGLLTSRQDGRFVIYTANFDAMTDLIGFLTENCCAGASCAAIDLPTACGGKR
ncbi:transcriptional regulator, ArsR family [Paraburkholderia caballeronis]|uniref:DNA-binding transcriptional regulator, ArsR family n=2 Tax=Paraburkholderia caballeronis TaxID=416943 RepID=A0A1H7FXY4_9BURK|nr:ArsR family transcriptional regulator [Paraburkholderia caballeronis]PXX00608.1 ArsR family transcriptional regulator [Paraburkholderia caballeronis]RAJ98671.1 ArsR family transcriptional regulator [Paraburkholderia caballeronis]SEE69743.1 transcriptional regulator, ArsR family [Paraburkholderia caballeronis]SEK28275.1 DNA-binding transcriptional regulator, ArsR family [Paraburkholderia caballeronis]